MTQINKLRKIKPLLKGLNMWTLKQKIKDHTIQRKSTFQLKYKIDTYRFTNPLTLQWFKMLSYTPIANPNIRFRSSETQIKFLTKFGTLRKTTNEMPSHSFVLQWLQVLECAFAGQYRAVSDAINILDTSNTARSHNTVTVFTYSTTGGYTFAFEAGGTDATYGIIAGTGTNAPTNADVVIQTPVAHGTSSGQLMYQPTAVGSAAIIGANVDMYVTRIVANTSGGTITLKEIGIYGKTETAGYIHMIARDAVNQAIADDEIAIIQYLFRTTV